MLRSTLGALVVSLSLAAYAHAQPPPGPPVHEERRLAALAGGEVARLVTRWAPTADDSGASIAIGSNTTALVHGASAAAIERGAQVAIVAYESFGDGAPFRFRVITGTTLGEERAFARPGGREGDYPLSVAIAPMPDGGFTVLFQEVQHDDPTAARTYAFTLDAAGAPQGEGRELAVPWTVAAAAWNGHGLHLGLLFPGYGTGMRLSMVSLSPAGQPEQHPDWASAAGFVGDVHLVRDGEHVRAFYRGGTSGDRLLESDVTAIRGWGSEPPRATDHGPLGADQAVLIDAHGAARASR
jgi:hypothetical protein